MRLCGISSRFQLLSPGTGQVTHALLTRPPLSRHSRPSEKFCPWCFVRLACVKHAASVHPEPGSNSHVKKSASRSKLSLANFNRSTVCLVRLNRSEISLFRIFRVVLLFSYQGSLSSLEDERRRRDLNPRAATNDLLPFQGSPFSHLGTSPSNSLQVIHYLKTEKVGFEPTVPFGITGFQDRLLKPLGHLSKAVK